MRQSQVPGFECLISGVKFKGHLKNTFLWGDFWKVILHPQHEIQHQWCMDIYGIKYPCQFSGPAQQVVTLIIWVWLPDLAMKTSGFSWLFRGVAWGVYLWDVEYTRPGGPWVPVHFRYNLVVLKNPDDRSCGWRLSISNYVAPIIPYLQTPFHKVPVETLEMLQLDQLVWIRGFSLEKNPMTSFKNPPQQMDENWG